MERLKYLDSFTLASADEEAGFVLSYPAKLEMQCYSDSAYPFKIFPQKKLRTLRFEQITLLYGGNGSGKSTLLNVIAEKLSLERRAPFNYTPLFEDYLAFCSYVPTAARRMPAGSAVITSDDVFDFLLDLRAINAGVDRRREALFEEYDRTKETKSVPLRSLEDYDALKRFNEGKRSTKSAYVTRRLPKSLNTASNGKARSPIFRTASAKMRFTCSTSRKTACPPNCRRNWRNSLKIPRGFTAASLSFPRIRRSCSRSRARASTIWTRFRPASAAGPSWRTCACTAIFSKSTEAPSKSRRPEASEAERYRLFRLHEQEIRLVQLARQRRVAFQVGLGGDGLAHRGDDEARLRECVDDVGKRAVVFDHAVDEPVNRAPAAGRIRRKVVMQIAAVFVARPDLVGRRRGGQRVFLRENESAARRQQGIDRGAELGEVFYIMHCQRAENDVERLREGGQRLHIGA